MGPASDHPDPSHAPGIPAAVVAVLERSTEAFCAFDRDWRHLYVNRQAERVLLAPRALLLGRTIWDVFPGCEGGTIGAEFRRAVADNVTAEFRAQWPPSGAWLDVRACPSEDGLAVYFHDVSAEVAAERALRETREHIRLITDSVPALISYVDRDLRYRFANATYGEWFGVRPEEVVGRSMGEMLGADVAEQRRPYVERALRGERVRFDGPTPHRALGMRDTEISYVPDAAGGGVRGFYVLAHDLTDRKRGEAAVRDGQELLRLAQRAAAVGVWDFDVRSGVTRWSEECHRVYGTDPATFVPSLEAWVSLVLEPDRARVQQAVGEALARHAELSTEFRVNHPARGVRVLWEVGRAEHDAEGRPTRMAGITLDVTDHRRAEEALRESERTLRESRERLRAALAAAEMGTWRVDLRTRVVTRDPETSRLLGLPGEESAEPLAAFFARVHPDDRATVEAAAHRAVADRGIYLVEFRVVCPDGSVRWIRDQGKVLCEDGPGGEPEPALMTGASVDISGRKRAEQVVREANQRMTAVMDASPLAVMAVDLRGHVMLWNPASCRMFGWAADEAVGRFLPSVPPADEELARDILRRTVAGEPVSGLEVRRLRKDGSTFDAALWTSRLDDAEGRPFAVLGILADVTERKQAEQALDQARREAEAARAAAEAASRAKDQFLAVLSHELRTPLTPVVMTLAGLELDRSLSQDVRDDLAMIRRNVELETRLIDDLLDVTRITHGKLRLHPQPTNVHGLVDSVLDILRSEIRGKRLELRCDLAAGDAVVSADAARLQQVIWNLVKNGIKFSPEGGRLSVRTSNPTPRTLALEVADNGIGIEPAALPRLFNAFEQAEQSVTRQFGGLGLGLAISRALVELHGGTIRGESAGRGRGATFVVELPTVGAIEKLVNQIQPPPGAAAAATGRRPVRVLLVEDHPDTLRTLKRLLEKMGYHVVPAGSAAAALNVLAGEAVDVLVSDIGLPDATGHELMRKVRASHDVPGIAVSGFGMDADIRNSREAGFVMHITKPIDLRQLDNAIRSAVGAPARA